MTHTSRSQATRSRATVALMCCSALLLTSLASSVPAQQASALTAADYGQWETLGSGELSPDGSKLVVGIRRVDGTTELRLHDIASPGTAIRVIENGSTPAFSADARWLAYRIGYSEAERERRRGDDEPLRNKMGLLDMGLLHLQSGEGGENGKSGEEEIFDAVASFAFDDAGNYLLMRGYAAEGRDAADLVVRSLETGTNINFGNVTEYAWQDDAPRLAMTVAAESGAGNGIQLYDAAASTLVVLDSGDATFTEPTWRKDGADLAVLRSVEDETHEEPTHIVLAWRALDAGVSAPLRFDHRDVADFDLGGDMRVVEHRAPAWSDDGSTIFFGIREWPAKPSEDDEATEDEDAAGGEPGDVDEDTTEPATGDGSDDRADDDEPEPADVDIWHALDERIIPMQKLQEQRDREKSYLSAWHIDEGRFVRLGTDYDETITLLAGQKYATETDRTPYIVDGMFGRRWYDIDLIDVATGERTRVVDRVRYFNGGSASGEHLLYFKDDQFFAYDIASGEHTDLTSNLPTSFLNEDYDFPVEQKPSWGVAGWAEHDEAVLLYDRYDIWSVRPDGVGALRLTDGAADEVRYRYVRLDNEPRSFGGPPATIDLDEPLYLSMYGEWTKKSGYARLAVSGEGGDPAPLVWLDKNVGRLTKADDAETFAYVVQGFDDSPDYFAGGPGLGDGGRDLGDAVQITTTNPFQADFAWGHSELIDYSCEFGPRVQGALYYPAGYEEGREYPMITYVYERLSQSVHRYTVPSERSSYNTAVWTSQGYFVLRPDIVFRGRMPGTSALECIRPAVKTVVDTGMVDGDRVGLVGHSWGGYEAAFVPTQTDIFAASVSGAALTNFFSMFGTIHWNQGMPESSHWETGQARMDVPYWDDMEAYIRESPVMGIPQLETPMLMAFGDNDGTVDWHQGVEMYNYARRAGKQFVMLVYADENHSNRQEKNQLDYHHRVLDWFGHYLKGEPAKSWIINGVSVIERNNEIKRR